MKFLIQTIDGVVKHDFSFTLLEAIRFNNWIHPNDNMTFKLTNNGLDEGYIPIGEIGFVTKYIEHWFGHKPKPINIPDQLMDEVFCGRTVINGTEKDIIGERFIKSTDQYKGLTTIDVEAPPGNYQISDVVDFKSEWRAFVYKGELVGLQNYSGEFDVFPNIGKIRAMIRHYTDQPVAFTLDVGIVGNLTVIVEVHDFFSCGLYGFAEHKILPHMFNRWFNEYKNSLC